MTILDEARNTIQAINANLSASPSGVRPNAKYGSVNPETGEVEWREKPRRVRPRSGFPFYSMSLSVAPEDVPATTELLKSHGVFAEFNEDGCPKIESSTQQRKIAQALGLFTGRDGYGHQTLSGRHENTGRIRGQELAAGRRKVDALRKELESMPEDASESAVRRVVNERIA